MENIYIDLNEKDIPLIKCPHGYIPAEFINVKQYKKIITKTKPAIKVKGILIDHSTSWVDNDVWVIQENPESSLICKMNKNLLKEIIFIEAVEEDTFVFDYNLESLFFKAMRKLKPEESVKHLFSHAIESKDVINNMARIQPLIPALPIYKYQLNTSTKVIFPSTTFERRNYFNDVFVKVKIEDNIIAKIYSVMNN